MAPAVLVFGLFCSWQTGWQGAGLAALGAYWVFNVSLSLLQQRHPVLLERWGLRGVGNTVLLALLLSQLGGVAGACLLAMPNAFGAAMTPRRRTSLAMVAGVVGGVVLGLHLAGVPPVVQVAHVAVLLFVYLVAARLYQPYLDGHARASIKERELQRSNERLVDALAARQIFLATMSHEIRTPLNGVSGMAEALTAAPLSPDHRELLEMLRGSEAQLRQIVDDIIDLIELDDDRFGLLIRPTAVGALAEAVADEVRQRQLHPGCTLRLHSTGLPSLLEVDGRRLQQVLRGLVGNAAKFTETGTVEVVLGWVPDELSVSVHDTGVGMAPELVARLFQPFSPGDPSAARRVQGLGLGLALCHRLVDRMGGQLGVESRLGVGSTFSFAIPARVPAVARPPAERALAPAPELSEAEVLVVDDNPVNLRVARVMLARLGCAVRTASSGAEALALMRGPEAGAIDAVFLDCQMPGLDGFETCRRLRAAGVSVPILALTAGVTREERQQCADAGMDAVVAKPATVVALRGALERWLAADRAPSRRASSA